MSWPEYEQWLAEETDYELSDVGWALRETAAQPAPFPKPAAVPPAPAAAALRVGGTDSSTARRALLSYFRFAGQEADCHAGEPAVARVDGRRVCMRCAYPDHYPEAA